MMLTGWEYYAHEPWHWPLAHTYGTGGPAGTNILYLDAIPLVAFAAKLVRTITGGHWHPYGLWHLAGYVLQAVFAALLARRIGLRSLLGGVAVAMLALSTHAFILRYYHEGLNGQFTILWALLCYLRTGVVRRRLTLAAEWAACLACAVLVHPYLGAMAAVIGAAAFARLATQDWRLSGAAAALVVAGLTAILIAFGYIPQKLPENPGEFGKASMNVMSLAIPYYSRIVPPLPIGQNMTGVQWDGGNFLGVGVWPLLVVAIVSAGRPAHVLVSRHKALAFVLALLAFYAPSNRAWLGETLVWSYEIPQWLKPLCENARATGRFFWPVTYVLVLAICALIHRRFGRRGTIIVAVAAAVQLADSTACWPVVTTSLGAPAKRYLDWSVWSAELAGASRVTMYPSYQCWSPIWWVPERVLEEEREIALLAASSGARTNGGRAGRAITDCSAEHDERANAAAGMLREDEVYVFFRPAYYTEILTVIGEGRCKEIGDAFVCRAGPREP